MSVDFKDLSCIGLLGGTFNPVHNGHLMMARCAYEQKNDIEKIIFMPNNIPAYKETEGIASNGHRVNMLEIATKDMDYALVSCLELKRGGTTYTYDTLNEIKRINPNIKIYFIIGADSLFSFDKWYRFREIFPLCTLLAVIRETSIDAMKKCALRYKNEYGADIELLNCGEVKASSTQIREAFKKGKAPMDILPKAVTDYILENGLYVEDLHEQE